MEDRSILVVIFIPAAASRCARTCLHRSCGFVLCLLADLLWLVGGQNAMEEEEEEDGQSTNG